MSCVMPKSRVKLYLIRIHLHSAMQGACAIITALMKRLETISNYQSRWNGLKQFPTVKGRWKYSSIPLQFIFVEVIVIQWYNMKWRKRPSLLWKKNFLLSVRVHNIMSSSCHGQRCSVKHHFERCLSHPVAEE